MVNNNRSQGHFAPRPAPTNFAPQPMQPVAPQAAPQVAPQFVPQNVAPHFAPQPAPRMVVADPVINPAPAALPVEAPQVVAPPTLRPDLDEVIDTLDLSKPVDPTTQAPDKGQKVKWRANTAPCCDWPQTTEGLIELAKFVGRSGFVPAAIRTTDMVDHTADVFMMLAKAQSMGISFVDTFSQIFVLPNTKTGDLRMGLYVKAKEGMCKPYGKWSVELNPLSADAIATGTRYDTGEKRTIVYTAYEAGQRGVLKHDASGQFVGQGNWAGKWMDMMKARAVGRLLDALFPDILGGFVTKEEFDDEAYFQELQRRMVRASAQDASVQPVQEDAKSAAASTNESTNGVTINDSTANAAQTVQVAQVEPTPEPVTEESAKAGLAKATAKVRRSRKAVEPEVAPLEPTPLPPESTAQPAAPSVPQGIESPVTDNQDAPNEPNPLA